MFDVSWGDPTRETVGQRRSRKEQQSIRSSRRSSTQSSSSADPSSMQIKPSYLIPFGGIKKLDVNRTEPESKPSTSHLDSAKALQHTSGYTLTSGFSEHELPDTSAPTAVNGFSSGNSDHSDAELSSPSDVSGSILSGWTNRSAQTGSSWSSMESTTSAKIIQPLSHTSFVTQSTEITISPRDAIKEEEHVATIVHISAERTIPVLAPNSPSSSPMSSTFNFPIPDFIPSEKSIPISNKDPEFRRPVSSRGRHLDSWKPPDAWGCPAEETISKLSESPFQSRMENLPIEKGQDFFSLSSEAAHLQRNIRRMEAASPKIVLERLKEDWVGIRDDSMYQELEVEMQLWMLSALKRLTKKDFRMDSEKLGSPSGITKVLSLHENHAFSSFLSALSTGSEVHHLSTHPLSPKAYPNIHPLTVPSPTSHLSYASNNFTSIHAFCLPSILPAASIPQILKECHRTLISSLPSSPTFAESVFSSTNFTPPNTNSKAGTLHLTILDPLPIPSTLGPLLRNWLDDHLILNLERQFRCINPSRLFPIWLADVGLRAEGSTIFNTRFLACVDRDLRRESRSWEWDMESSASERHETYNTKQELKSMVGRMIWKEMWGPYVEGDQWWWEDDSLLEECARMGTSWEYAIIEAVKEG